MYQESPNCSELELKWISYVIQSVGKPAMPENAKDSVYERDNLERVIAEAFSTLWELGVLGVKLTLSHQIVKLKVYLLSEVEDCILDNALGSVEAKFDQSYKIERQIVHGIVPAAKIVTSLID